MSSLLNPTVSFLLIWLTTIVFFQFKLSDLLLDFNLLTVIFLLSICFVAIAVQFIFLGVQAHRKPLRDKEMNYAAYEPFIAKVVRRIAWFWGIFSVLEVIIFKGVPLLWLFQGSELNYTDFGIPTIHGFLNALFLVLVSLTLVRYIMTKSKRQLVLYFLLLTWPIFLMTRQMLVSALLQTVCIVFFIKEIRKRSMAWSFAIFFGVVTLFGYLGDVRSGKEGKEFFQTLVQPSERWPEFLPQGFLWVYVYVTTPINNIVANIETIEPVYYPYNSIAPLIPSFLRKQIFPEEMSNSFELVTDALNVSTAFLGLLLDFGITGTIVFFILIFWILNVTYYRCLNSKERLWWIIAYSGLFQCLINTIFTNLFFQLTFIFQYLFVLFLMRKARRYLPKQAALPQPADMAGA